MEILVPYLLILPVACEGGRIDYDSPDSMGLSIVRSLAEYELDGSITFETDDGFQVTVKCELN